MIKRVHDKFNLAHLKTCETCQSSIKSFTVNDLINKKFTHSDSNRKISFLQAALKVLLLLKSLRHSIIKFTINEQSPLILDLQQKLLKATDTESVKIEETAIKFLRYYDRFIIIEDSLDAVNVIMNLFHSNKECKKNCPFHENVLTEFIVKSCSLSLNVGNHSFYKFCELKNDSENIFRQYAMQVSRGKCLICKQRCSKGISCERGYEYLCFKLESCGQLIRYDSVLPIRIESTELFNQKNIGVFQLNLLITTEQKIFALENNVFKDESSQVFPPQRLFEIFYSNNIQVLGAIYTLAKNQGVNHAKSKKMSDVTCKCGDLFEIGESMCRRCGANMIFNHETVEKKPNLKYKRDEEIKFQVKPNREIQIKSKTTTCIEKPLVNK